MTSEGTVPDPYFVAYFDEAGDPGIKTVAPLDPKGASEWFTVGCCVIRAANEPTMVRLVQDIKQSIHSTQSPDLHFRTLVEHKKLPVCQALAAQDMRLFVVASHKTNMRGYRNPKAEAVSLHRTTGSTISAYACFWSGSRNGVPIDQFEECKEPRHVKLVFSKRGGHSYRHVETYVHLLINQIENGRLFLTARAPDARVLDHRLIEVIEHNKSAGCQIADVVASSFFQAANVGPKKWTTTYAQALEPRVARKAGLHANFGLTLLPWQNWTLRLSPDQRKVFRFYGYNI
ncbi:MAG: DUF3800 domain-containing protein [Bryobacteraceae bacterium]